MDGKVRFAEVVLVILIVLNILDFFKFLPEDLDFVKKIISWTILAVLFYKIGFVWIFLGKDKCEKCGILPTRALDGFILVFYLLFLVKNLLAITVGTESNWFHSLFLLFATYGAQIELVSFYVGGIGLLVISFYLAFCKINEPSLLGNLHLTDKPWLVKFIAIFLVLTSFLILVFDLVLEWLGIAVDSLIIIVALIIYFVFIVKNHQRFMPGNLLYRIGNFGETFYERVIRFFHDKEKIFLGVTGLLILHLLTEVGNFLLPYVFNLTNSLYFHKLGHQPIYSLLSQDVANFGFYAYFSYIFNVFAIFALVILAGFIWFEIYKNQRRGIPGWVLALFFASLPSFLLTPSFKLKALVSGELVGVNLVSQNIFGNIQLIVLVSIAFGIIIFLLSFSPLIKKMLYHLTIASSLAFLFYYLFLFYSSTAAYYNGSLKLLLGSGMFLVSFYFLIFYLIKILFLVFAVFKLLIQMIRDHLL